MTKRATLADVARRAGLSPSTVSMVLNERPGSRIPEETAQRVRSAARELDYVPNATARGLRTGRTGVIGFISDEVTLTRYASAMIRGALDAAEAHDYVLVMAECDHQRERIARAMAQLQARRIEGLLFGLMSARRVDLPPLGATPGLIVNGTAPGLRPILPDEYEAGRTAVAHLVRNGHRRIALIGRSTEHLEPAVSVTIGRRMAGIDDGLARAGIALADEVGARFWEPEVGYEGTLAILERTPGITAILAANDRIALGVYQAAQAAGLTIPADLSVMSFDDEQLATYLRPQVTTMRLPYLDMGRIGMESLIGGDAPTGANGADGEVLVPMPLVERGSVARSPS
jgi:LacI family transcriptional regulator